MAGSIRGVLFDKDGTLFDFQATWGGFTGLFLRELAQGDEVLFAALAEAADYDDEARRLRPGSAVIAGTPMDVAELLHPYLPAAMGVGALADRINAGAASVAPQPAADLHALLSDLRARGVALGVATNDAEVPARAHLAATGIADSFDFIAGYDSGYGGKPAPGQLIAFARSQALDPVEVVMVGDSLHDLMAGRAAGMATVGVLTGLASRDDLAPLADAVLPDIGELPAWLDERAT